MKNMNLIEIDAEFRNWLLDVLSDNPPESQCCQDIVVALNEMRNGMISGMLLCDLDGYLENRAERNKTMEMNYGELSIIPKSRQVFHCGKEVILTPKEYDILFFLAKNQGEIFTKEQIYRAVWDDEYLLDDGNIMAFIRKLRKKIEPNADAPHYIITIWGIGYKFNDQL